MGSCFGKINFAGRRRTTNTAENDGDANYDLENNDYGNEAGGYDGGYGGGGD
jgi:hypothetical protein